MGAAAVIDVDLAATTAQTSCSTTSGKLRQVLGDITDMQKHVAGSIDRLQPRLRELSGRCVMDSQRLTHAGLTGSQGVAVGTAAPRVEFF